MSSDPAKFELGSVVADRRIDSIAGEGGMGVVYRAWNLRLKRVEAVKVISHEFVRDPSFRERFERETEIAANIHHPHVVTLYHSGEGPGGQLFIAMQYVEGTTLDRLIRQRGRVEPDLAAELIAQTADALDAAHDQGLVHRDVKPANILLEGSDDDYHVYLTDFGLAKRVAAESSLTGVGLMVGTVDFMAPEQAGAQPVDLRADVYALGATLFMALTGQVPYPRQGEVARLVAKMSEPPPAPSQVVPGLRATFDAVIARAMAEKPDDRFQSAGELGESALAATGRRTPYSNRKRERRSVAPAAVDLGSVIDGRYRIDAAAGSGGMAVVYRATHLKLNKTVAIKVMSPSLADDPEFQRRFEDEARSASEIDHDHVIPVYDFGEDEHGLYLVMRYVEGNLRTLLRERGRLEPIRAVQIIEQVAMALDAAHARGLLHRDVKPANILVEESTGRIFLADFGLVRTSQGGDGLTRSKVIGTDWYMAPERRHHEETKLGDVYSLGCVLWEMLAGPGSHLPGRSARDDDADVPSALRLVVERAVSERPLDRYQSAGDLARAARAALAPMNVVDRASQREPLVFQEPLTAGLSARVLQTCGEMLRRVTDPGARAELEAIGSRLSEPLALAVAGHANAGKSTLVNALLGRRVAATGVEEARRPVTWYRHGSSERVELVLAGGERRTAQFTPEGLVPGTFGVPLEAITAIEVWLAAEALQSLTVVDDPAGAGERAGDASPGGVLERADAILFAMGGDSAETDREALEAFRARVTGSGRATAINAIGVLTKADLFLDADDSWERALERAQALHTELGSLVSAVVPIAGRIAEIANTGGLTEDDAAQLSNWAATSESDRRRLLDLLGVYGVQTAIALAESGEPFTSVTLSRHLRELSGIDELRKQIAGLQLRSDALKADAALSELESLSWRYHLEDLRNQVDRQRLDAPVLELMRVFDRCVSGEIELEPGRLQELEQLLTGRTMAERLGLEVAAPASDLRAVATRRAREWRTWAGGGLASFQGQLVANKVDDIYMQIAFSE